MPESEVLAHLLRDALESGASVEIDGLGTFRRDPRRNQFTFVRKCMPKVFIAYVHEDGEVANRLFEAFAENGFDPWMDRRKLMPGQNWPRAIQNAMETSDFAVTCFSRNSVGKRGGFQAEIRYALDCASRIPLEEIFLVPVRLDDCRVPARIQREVQYVDLFPDWKKGFQRVLRIMKAQARVARAVKPAEPRVISALDLKAPGYEKELVTAPMELDRKKNLKKRKKSRDDSRLCRLDSPRHG